MSDAELVALSQQGNLQAFNDLAHRWDGSLFRFARRTLGDDEEARDVCQEALTKAYLNIGRLRDPAKFKSWVHHIALNLCRDRFRSPRHRAAKSGYEEGEAGEMQMVEAMGNARTGEREERRVLMGRLLEGVMERLPEEQRTAILLREYQGFTSEEIGEITGVPATTVRTRIFYGLKTLRKALNERGVTSLEGR
jgi:RNA polymerase sigma-70 factor (ECF subfamily)